MSFDYLPEFLCRHPIFLQSPRLCCQQDTSYLETNVKMHLNSKSKVQSECPQWGLKHPQCLRLNLKNHRHLAFSLVLNNLSESDIFSTTLTRYVWSVWKILRFFDFDWLLFGPFNLLLPLWSTLRALLNESPISCLRILSLRTTSWISSNFSFSDPQELLIATTIVSHDSGKDNIKISALISSSKLIFTELNWLTIILNYIEFIYMISNRSTFRHL